MVMRGTAGGTFTVVPSPDREGAPATNFLEDVSGPSSDDLWAVGCSRNPRRGVEDADRALERHGLDDLAEPGPRAVRQHPRAA